MSELFEKLREAAGAGDIDAMRRHIAAGADPLSIEHGDSVIFTAAFNNQLEAVKFLLDLGVPPDMHANGHATALDAAAHEGNEKIVLLLLAAGADPQLRARGQKTPWDWACLGKNQKHVPFLENLQLDQVPALLYRKAAAVHEVVVTRFCHDRVLQEVFNFSARERVTYIRKAGNAPVEAVLREPFEDLRREDVMRAYQDYARRPEALPPEKALPAIFRRDPRQLKLPRA